MLICYGVNDDPMHNDIKWINSQIDKLPYMQQAAITERYSEIYSQLLIDDKRNCRARANTWLRNTVNKYKVTA